MGLSTGHRVERISVISGSAPDRPFHPALVRWRPDGLDGLHAFFSSRASRRLRILPCHDPLAGTTSGRPDSWGLVGHEPVLSTPDPE